MLRSGERSLATGKPFEDEVRYRAAATGNIVGFVSRRAATGWARQDPQVVRHLSDIEDRKRAEEEREKLRADLAHVNRVSMLESWLPPCRTS